MVGNEFGQLRADFLLCQARRRLYDRLLYRAEPRGRTIKHDFNAFDLRWIERLSSIGVIP